MSARMWPPERLKVWQILFLLFPFLLWVSWSSYQDFTRLEEEGGVLYVGRTTKMLYELGGKWAVVGTPLLGIAFWGYALYHTLKLSKKADELRERAENPRPPAVVRAPSQPPVSKPAPIIRPKSPSGPLTPLAASAPPPSARVDDVPPDPSGPRLLR
jgi:hypothetical protein